MKFHKDVLDDCLDGDAETIRKISDKLRDKGRWRSIYGLVFESGGSFFGVLHEEGNDENCDFTRWDADKDGMVECFPLVKASEVKTVYVTQEQIDKSGGKIVAA